MLQIETIEVTPFQQNCRVVVDEKSRNAVVVDPGGEAGRIVEYLKTNGWQCSEIWLTHAHLDHCGGVADLKELTGALLTGHPNEKILRVKVTEICAMYGIPQGLMKNCPEPERFVSGGESLPLGEAVFEVLFCPGHSPGHVCFYCRSEGVLLAGDTVFAGSIGRTDLPGGDHGTLISNIKEKILTLPESTRILSGHGPDTTVGIEKRSNPFLVR